MVLGPDHVNSSELQVWAPATRAPARGKENKTKFLLCPPGTPASHPLCRVRDTSWMPPGLGEGGRGGPYLLGLLPGLLPLLDGTVRFLELLPKPGQLSSPGS